MYLKRIELQGFKSFAGKTILEFNRGITSVVGPNGSGKSNIADAVRWVLGEQSAKQLRGSKMLDVIFSGTQFRKSVGFAEVILVVDNTEGKLPIDYTEIAVKRRLYRSGESEYSINNNHCRLKDIRELFLDTGVGRNGYSIISQGKVQEVLSQKSEDRRQQAGKYKSGFPTENRCIGVFDLGLDNGPEFGVKVLNLEGDVVCFLRVGDIHRQIGEFIGRELQNPPGTPGFQYHHIVGL